MPSSLFRRRLTLSLSLSALSIGSLAGCGDNDAKVEQGEKLCEAQMKLTGTFTQASPQPADVFGCWPVGTWSLVPQKETLSDACGQSLELQPSYDFKVIRDVDDEEGTYDERYEYLSVPGYERAIMKVTSGGSGLCEGGFEVFSPDGKEVLNLKAFLYADQHIDGVVDFSRYAEDRWPGLDAE